MRVPDLLRLVYRNIVVNTDYGTLTILLGLTVVMVAFLVLAVRSYMRSGVSFS